MAVTFLSTADYFEMSLLSFIEWLMSTDCLSNGKTENYTLFLGFGGTYSIKNLPQFFFFTPTFKAVSAVTLHKRTILNGSLVVAIDNWLPMTHKVKTLTCSFL